MPAPTPGTTCATAPAIAESITLEYTGDTVNNAWLRLDVLAGVQYAIQWAASTSTSTGTLSAGPSCSSLTPLHTFAQQDTYTFIAAPSTNYYVSSPPWPASAAWSILFAANPRPRLRQFVYATGNPTSTISTIDQFCQVTEYPTPTSSSEPIYAIQDSQGNYWTGEIAGSAFCRVTPGAQIAEYPTLTGGAGVGNIIEGPDGRIWATQPNVGNICACTQAGVVSEYTPTTPGTCTGPLCIGRDNNIWTVEPTAANIARCTTTGTITEFHVASGSTPAFITSGPDGNLWATDPGLSQIIRCTPTGVITTWPTPTPTSGPGPITEGPDGNLWFAETSASKIGRITPAGVITEFPTITPFSQPYALARDRNGNTWFTEGPANQLGCIDRHGHMTEYTLPITMLPEALTIDQDGYVRFPATAAPNIGKIHPNRTIEICTITSGNTPSNPVAPTMPTIYLSQVLYGSPADPESPVGDASSNLLYPQPSTAGPILADDAAQLYWGAGAPGQVFLDSAGNLRNASSFVSIDAVGNLFWDGAFPGQQLTNSAGQLLTPQGTPIVDQSGDIYWPGTAGSQLLATIAGQIYDSGGDLLLDTTYRYFGSGIPWKDSSGAVGTLGQVATAGSVGQVLWETPSAGAITNTAAIFLTGGSVTVTLAYQTIVTTTSLGAAGQVWAFFGACTVTGTATATGPVAVQLIDTLGNVYARGATQVPTGTAGNYSISIFGTVALTAAVTMELQFIMESGTPGTVQNAPGYATQILAIRIS